MALRNQPYIPLYVQDFLTDEKLAECSAESTGVYIRLMCILHKSDEYGCILLKQKDKQNKNICLDFAYKLARQMPYDVDTIQRSLEQLIEEKVLILDGDKLYQKRMVKDGEISEKRSNAGSKGGKTTGNKLKKITDDFASSFAKAKEQANTEYEDEIINENEIIDYYINNINCNISSIEYEKLNYYIELFKNDLRIIKYAIEYCKMYKAFNINYLCKILHNWEKSRFKTLEEIKSKEKILAKEKENIESAPPKELFDYNWLDDDENIEN